MLGMIRSFWDEPRAPGAPGRGRLDWTLVAVFGGLAVVEGFTREDLPARWVTVALALALLPLLLIRRSHPVQAVVLAFVSTNTLSALTREHLPQNWALVGLVLLPYALFRWGSGREIAVGGLVVLGAVVSSMLVETGTVEDVVGGSAFILAILALAVALRYRAGARLRATDQVKLMERERLARELHDIVAHHVSAIAIRAQAGLATAAVRPGAAVEALEIIEAEAAKTLTEMRTMVKVLRGPAGLTPGPGLADLAQLADPRRPGPPVDLRITGDVGDLPPTVGATVFRLAQESVTNARRHARHATRIEVHVDADPDAVRLRVSDDGEPVSVWAGGSGFGLLGMRERATLLGGSCEAGPDPGRGWTVTAVLPRAGVAA